MSHLDVVCAKADCYLGMKWLVENHPELFENISFVINEGGGVAIRLPKADLYLLQTAEKRSCWLRLVAESAGGHGSIKLEDSHIDRIIKSASALNKAGHDFSCPKIWRYLSSIIPIKGFLFGKKREPAQSTICELKSFLSRAPRSFIALKNLFSNSINVKGIVGYSNPNVIPSKVEATVDLRVLPNVKTETIIKKIQALLANWIVKVEVIEAQEGFEISPDLNFISAIRSVLKEEISRAELAPYMLPSSSDAKFVVQKGLKVYGFFSNATQTVSYGVY